MSWGECTVTFEDVAYQLGLPINSELVSGCLWNFENLMPEGTGRPPWDWFLEMPEGHVSGGSWEVPFMEPACVPTPPASPALAEQPDEPAERGRARRAPRRRGCGTGGHM
ncbi:hypothetical protein PIB30_075319 [Stylosanthes scabra]|uniref:Uncharacterized protein n=1 Tax=Stylosanthes scabra TaxID=79078 RepID=A0ABU6YSJ5_9FABA|nr:hypothetical protein [Stylosanthes scabra]